MNLVDFLLNVACLLLWVVWRSMGFTGVTGRSQGLSVLKHAGPPRSYRNSLLLGLVVLLVLRAWLYWRVGSEVGWVASLDLGVITLPVNSALLVRMLIYSFLAFGVFLVIFYLWLILLSIVNRGMPDTDLTQKRVRQHLGWAESWPIPIQLLAPVVLTACLWYVANPLVVELGMAGKPVSSWHLWQQGIVLGLGTFLSWKYLLAALLLLHVLNSYLYLGTHYFWSFLSRTARNLLRPIGWLPLRVASVDLTPVVGIAIVFLVLELGQRGLTLLFSRLPL